MQSLRRGQPGIAPRWRILRGDGGWGYGVWFVGEFSPAAGGAV